MEILKRPIVAAFYIILISLSLLTLSCSQKAEMERAANKRKDKILLKIEACEKLSSSDIHAIGSIYALNQQYSKGVDLLNRLGNDARYDNEKYLLYLNLAQLYLEETRAVGVNKKELIEKAKKYLELSIPATEARAAALYSRSSIFAYEGCVDKAVKDLQDAEAIALNKKLIWFDDGMYLSRDKFISTIQPKLESIKKYKNNCELD
jgi:hypothetical protein